MAGGKEPIEVKFRLFDGTDIGPNKYDPATTVTALKEFVLARWPQGETDRPLSFSLPISPCRRVYIHVSTCDAICFGEVACAVVSPLVPLSVS
jgi:hypothetical protein